MNFRIVEREAFQAVGIKREFSCGTGNEGIPGVPGFWDEAHENGIVAKLETLINGQIPGLLGITENFNPAKNAVDYWIAAEHSGNYPDALKKVEFPASKWVVFEIKGPIPTAMIDAWKKIYSEWLPTSEYTPAGIAPIEAYIDSDLSCPASINEIWLAIK